MILGFTFKENCPDVRNIKVIDIYNALKEYNVNLTIYDPWVKPDAVMHEYGIKTINKFPEGKDYSAIILAVAHKEFMSISFQKHKNNGCIIYDVKGIVDFADARL